MASRESPDGFPDACADCGNARRPAGTALVALRVESGGRTGAPSWVCEACMDAVFVALGAPPDYDWRTAWERARERGELVDV